MTEPIGMTRPPELPDKTIVLDRYGKAWQRHGREWWRACDDVVRSRDWVNVLLGFGPVTVLLAGPESDPS